MHSPSKLNIAIIDDSKQARKLLRLMLLEYGNDVHVIGEAENVDDALVLIKSHDLDALFLDIEMPGRSGLQLAEELNKRSFKGQIIFTTAYNAYAIQAFRLSALDYLLKPIQENELIQALEKLRRERTHRIQEKQIEALTSNLQEDSEAVICVPVQGGYDYIKLKDICCIEADGSYAKIISADNKQKVVSKNLKYFETSLESIPRFLRPHRSFLVNMDQVLGYSRADGGSLSLRNGMQIPIARDRKQLVKEYISKQ